MEPLQSAAACETFSLRCEVKLFQIGTWLTRPDLAQGKRVRKKHILNKTLDEIGSTLKSNLKWVSEISKPPHVVITCIKFYIIIKACNNLGSKAKP